ncbi:MAG: sulfoxide reductase heme-binding subunit YedZ [Deltaproteobacteria bacterium]|nr:sulfoxide reductase heme-binding subunit YedZ [Deltaproteobacteria bacterium]
MVPPRRWLVPFTVAAGSVPLGKLAFEGLTGGLGANPIAEALNRLGFWTLTLLTLTLAATPAHDWLGLAWPARIRRALGLLTFAYATLHLSCYAAVDQLFDLDAILADVAKRPFIAIGLVAFLLLVPLAVTSTDRAVRRLGFRRWKALHRLTYAVALAGIVHYLWRVKIDLRRPVIFAVVLGALALLRILPRPSRARETSRAGAAGRRGAG